MNQVESLRLTPHLSCFCTSCQSLRPPKKSSRKRAIKRRKRKSLDQLRALQDEFERSTEWGKDLVAYLAHLTGLSEAQVYKWGWDQKKKIQGKGGEEFTEEESLRVLFDGNCVVKMLPAPPTLLSPSPTSLHCIETILPSSLDSRLYQVQKSYKYPSHRSSLEEFLRRRHSLA